MTWYWALTGLLVVATCLTLPTWHWQKRRDQFRSQMQAALRAPAVTVYDPREIAALPPPVQRYFTTVLRDGQAMISSASLSQQGSFLLDEKKGIWQPFHATQYVTTIPPGFDWDARIRMVPGINVFVRDSYARGSGALHAAVFGLATVADMRDTPDMARGELLRYLAESPWYPTALLPSQGISWKAIDDHSAEATLTDGATTVSLVFDFGADGLIETAWTPSRPRTATTSAPWLGRFSNYARRGDMLVPLEGEVEWQLENGSAPYWRGRVVGIDYQFAAV